jgi:hypothetical protein
MREPRLRRRTERLKRLIDDNLLPLHEPPRSAESIDDDRLPVERNGYHLSGFFFLRQMREV